MAYQKDYNKSGKAKALENYIPVNERIIKFYEKYPEGSLQVEVINEGLDATGVEFVVMRAKAYRTPLDPRPGVGHAHETREGMVNKDSMYENAETSAWGRALASLGFEVQRGIASQEEIDNHKRRAGEAQHISKEEAEKIEAETKKRMELFGEISSLHKKLDLVDDAESIKKKNELREKAGIESQWNAMSLDDLAKYAHTLKVEVNKKNG